MDSITFEKELSLNCNVNAPIPFGYTLLIFLNDSVPILSTPPKSSLLSLLSIQKKYNLVYNQIVQSLFAFSVQIDELSQKLLIYVSFRNSTVFCNHFHRFFLIYSLLEIVIHVLFNAHFLPFCNLFLL